MGLRIKTNVSSLQAQRQLGLSTSAVQENMEKLTSGYRINKASDDAAGLAISEGLKAKIRSLNQARRNASDGISMVQVAEGSMNEISNILVRLRELATQSASDTIGNMERSFTNREYTQLVDEIDRITNSTEFNGTMLLKGAEGNEGRTQFSIHVGAGDASVENVDNVLFDIDELKTSSEEILKLGKEAEIGPIAMDESFSRETAAEKLTVIDTAINRINSSRATLGAKQSRLNSAINNLGIQVENMNSANSRVRDVDFAAETAAYTQNRILSQAGVSVLAQANQTPELALTLLR